MTDEQRKVMENYVAELEAVAHKAEQLQPRVDSGYGEILQKEIDTYRELIAIWRERLKSD